MASAILEKDDYASSLKRFGQKYSNAGYGTAFFKWLFSPGSEVCNNWGNGSAMKVSPIGFAFDTIKEVAAEAQKSAEVPHNHLHVTTFTLLILSEIP